MTATFYPLLFLACPLGMGFMMWLMMRGGRTESAALQDGEEIARLRTEVERLRFEHGANTPEKHTGGDVRAH